VSGGALNSTHSLTHSIDATQNRLYHAVTEINNSETVENGTCLEYAK